MSACNSSGVSIIIDVGPFGGFGDLHHLELLGLRLLDALRALAQRHGHVLDAGIAQIERMGMALAAIADDGDLLALDQVDVGVAIVINAHDCCPLLLAASWASIAPQPDQGAQSRA